MPSGIEMTEADPEPGVGRPLKMADAELLDIAMHAYWRADPADVSLNATCEMAAISKPSLYRAFGSEDGLTLAVLDGYAEQVLADLFAILHSGQDLKATLAAFTEFACADPRMETG